MTRPRPDRSKDSAQNKKSPVPANLVLAEGDKDVDFTEIFTSDKESHEVNAAQPDGGSESVDNAEYFLDGRPEEEGDTPGGVPPTPLRPRDEASAFRVILDHDEDLNIMAYYTESEDEGMDDAEWLKKYTQFPLGTKFSYSDDASVPDSEDKHVGNDVTSDVDPSLIINITSESAYEGDISNQAEDTSLPLKTK